MSKWRDVYWNDFKSFGRKYGLVIVVVVGCMALIQYAKVLANAKNDYIQELEQYNKLLESEKIEMLKAFDELLEVEIQLSEECERLEDENQILGSYLAEYEIQYEQ
jgi:hypothetical protein